MSRYYFDIRDGEELIVDDVGTDMFDLEAVQVEAAQSLAEMAGHAVWSGAKVNLAFRMGHSRPGLRSPGGGRGRGRRS